MTSVQGELIKHIIKALLDLDSKVVHNESTFKNNFFSSLKEYNDEYEIITEKKLSEVVPVSENKTNDRLDYYLMNNTSQKNDTDIAIEFKIDCLNKNLINHDLKKLEKVMDSGKKIVGLFVNIFTRKLDFSEFIKKFQKIYSSTKAHVIIIAKVGMTNFYYKTRGKTYSFNPKQTVYITNSKRLKIAFYRAQHNLLLPYNDKNTKLEIIIPKSSEKFRKIKLSYFKPKNKKDNFGKLQACEHDLNFLYYTVPDKKIIETIEVNNELP